MFVYSCQKTDRDLELTQINITTIRDRTKTYVTVGHSEWTPTEIKGKIPNTPYSDFTLGTLVFTH